MNRRGFLGAILAGAAMVAVSRFLPVPAIKWPKWAPDEPRTVYVDSSGGSDDNDGEASSPFKTLGAAVLACCDGCTIQCLPGHSETISSPITIVQSNLTIRGATLNCASSYRGCFSWDPA